MCLTWNTKYSEQQTARVCASRILAAQTSFSVTPLFNGALRIRGNAVVMFNPELAANRRLVDRVARAPFLQGLAATLQPPVKAAHDRTPSAVRDLLHGRPIGHSLHVILTDVPVGAWTVTAVLDVLSAFGAEELDAGADAALAIGWAGGLGAAVTGLADWSDTADEPRTLGAAHWMLNAVAMSAYAMAYVAGRAGARGVRRVLALAGYGAVGAAAYLGGELASGMQLGAKHTAEPLSPPEEFVPTVSHESLSDQGTVRVAVNGMPVLLSRRGEDVFAVAAVCTHRGGPLEVEKSENGCIECPWHGSRFSLLDGSVAGGPATFPLARLETRVRDGMIEVRRFTV